MKKIKAQKVGTESVQQFKETVWNKMGPISYEHEGKAYTHGGWVEIEDKPIVPKSSAAKVAEAVRANELGDCTAEELVNFVVESKLQIKGFRLMIVDTLFKAIVELTNKAKSE